MLSYIGVVDRLAREVFLVRRNMAPKPNPRSRSFIYLCTILALSVYAVPKLPALSPGLAGTFSTLWILFAVLAVSANLYFLVGADKERSRMLEEKGGTKPRGEAVQEQRVQRRRAH